MMPRKLSKYILRKRVSRWGPHSDSSIVVVFKDGKMAVVDVNAGIYWSVKAWNIWVRDRYDRQAVHRFDGTLEELLATILARG